MRRIAVVSAVILMLAVSGAADVDSPSDLSSVGCRVRETALGDLVADAVRASGGAPIALVAAGSFREITIPQGKIASADVLKCLQYPDDQVTVIEITGEQLIRALERSVSIYPQRNMGFLQVSGLVFTFDPGAPKGRRVTSVMVGGEKAANDRKYRVATTKPLANGAYGYFTVWGKDQPQESKGKTTEQAVTEFLSARTSVDYRELNRILLKKD